MPSNSQIDPTPERMAEIRAIREAARGSGVLGVRFGARASSACIRLVSESPQIIDELLAALDEAREAIGLRDGVSLVDALRDMVRDLARIPSGPPMADDDPDNVEAELARVSQLLGDFDDNQGCHTSVSSHVAALIGELQSARADAERIDWLERARLQLDFIGSYSDEDGAVFPDQWQVYDAEGIPCPPTGEMWTSARSAIDAAREVTP